VGAKSIAGEIVFSFHVFARDAIGAFRPGLSNRPNIL